MSRKPINKATFVAFGYFFLAASISVAQFSKIYNVPGDSVPSALSSNSQINLTDGGFLPGPEHGVREIGSYDGTISNVELNVSGGEIGPLRVYDGSRANLSGGMGGSVAVNQGANADISGGDWWSLSVSDTASVSLSGGSFTDRALQASSHSELSIAGNDFYLNGQPILELAESGMSRPVTFDNGSTLTGRFADGTPFGFAGFGNGYRLDGFDWTELPPAQISLTSTTLPYHEPRKIDPLGTIPEAIAAGESLYATEDTTLPHLFKALPGSELQIGEGATAGIVSVMGADAHVNGGNVQTLESYAGGTTFIDGGSIGTVLGLSGSKTVITNMIEGEDRSLQFVAGSDVNLVGRDMTINGEPLNLEPGERMLIEDRPLPNIPPVGEVVIRESESKAPYVLGITFDSGRDSIELGGELSGWWNGPVLAYDFDLDATIWLTQAFPEGYCDLNGDSVCDVSDADLLHSTMGSDESRHDFNYDGFVDGQDMTEWLRQAGSRNLGHSYAQGDLTLDGIVDSEDLGMLLNSFGSLDADWSSGDLNGDSLVNSRDLGLVLNDFSTTAASPAAVPEPSSAMVVFAGMLAMSLLRRKIHYPQPR